MQNENTYCVVNEFDKIVAANIDTAKEAYQICSKLESNEPDNNLMVSKTKYIKALTEQRSEFSNRRRYTKTRNN